MASVCWGLDIKGLTRKKDKTPDIDIVTWLGQEVSGLPNDVDGVKIFRPNTIGDDGRIRVDGNVALPAKKQSQGFIAAYIYASDNLGDADRIDAVDYDGKSFSVYREIREGEYKDAAVYRFVTDYVFSDGKMSFSTYDINIEYKEKGILPRKISIEKFKPATNERHRELSEGFSLANSILIDDMAEAALEEILDRCSKWQLVQVEIRWCLVTKPVDVTHWTDIKAGKIVKGMNETEVRLISGAPRSVSPLGESTQWMYTNDFIIIFTDGIVSNVIQD